MLGFGFLESAYGDALEIEFKKAGIPYVREDPVRIYYDGQPLQTTWRADFTCFDREFVLGLKAIKTITKIEGLQSFLWKRAVHVGRIMRYNIPHGKENQRWT